MKDSYLYSLNAGYIEKLYNDYLLNPNAFDQSWIEFFRSLGDSSKGSPESSDRENYVEKIKPSSQTIEHKNSLESREEPSSLQINTLKDAYRKYGHLLADTNPIFENQSRGEVYQNFLNPSLYGLCNENTKVKDTIATLERAYCKNISADFMHLDNIEEISWIASKFEDQDLRNIPSHKKLTLFFLIQEANLYEMFLHKKKPGAKRFSVEGAETSLIALQEIINTSPKTGIKEIVLTMLHRGRLSVMTNILQKPFVEIFAQFEGAFPYPEGSDFSGDVKYHAGTSATLKIDGDEIYISLTANASHLESAYPISLGKARAKQDTRYNKNKDNVLPVIFHGDASCAGQGVVYESCAISGAKGYNVGGAIHIVINNQVGFTANPEDCRSQIYSGYIAKCSDFPIFIANGNCPEEVALCAKWATEFRNKFHKDVLIEIICYRKYGHNESDEPLYTQPLLYKKISERHNVVLKYAELLKKQGIITDKQIEEKQNNFTRQLDSSLARAKDYKFSNLDCFEGNWKDFSFSSNDSIVTSVTQKMFDKLKDNLTSCPDDFFINTKLSRLFKAKNEMFKTGENFDWGTAESIAFASLLLEGFNIRLSGQDSARGTFSHRHSVIVDQNNGDKFIPLNQLSAKQGHFEVINSPLSEYAVMGFEYGYSLVDPNTLTLWEGQFGDFANGAQIIIDQYISSAEQKWLRSSGLVLLLPHAHEGQGSEHTSGRPERFLQLCAQNNMYIVNCSTPANYCHVLRRQMLVKHRKPLVIFTPKSLLRHKLAVSNASDFKGRFLTIIGERDSSIKTSAVKKIILCTGKIFYDLLEERSKRKINDTAIITCEQLYPFPETEFIKELSKYNTSAQLFWCQEEPKNLGYWSHLFPILTDISSRLDFQKSLEYIGRNPSATPAEGFMHMHNKTQSQILDQVFSS